MNYPSGAVPNYPVFPQNTISGGPVYYPPGNPAGNNYPQYPGNVPYPNPGVGYGFIKNRSKRQTNLSKNKNNTSNKSSKKYKSKTKTKQKDTEPKVHWGVHRILSTGNIFYRLKQIVIISEYFPFSCHHLYTSNIYIHYSGTLAPPMLAAKDSMDLIFSTHWVYPARIPVLQPIDQDCIRNQVIRTGMFG